ncbi:hypothetical protein [Nesterenkonia halotolerans]|uniref:Anti-sigma factor n=1 Tax=Nesterenkonia halotolerans TaxID=225325 RepID=A0ABR9J4L6_9MICC|nr:hypothetical protein [Nesterenkonia halotolerans]MBE1513909.1 hypothetical protein [Nesterenkonia halotolerans]
MNQNHDDADPRLEPTARPGQAPLTGAEHVTQRQAELLGAAAADDLSPAERQELETMCAQNPWLAQELRQLRRTSSALGQHLGGWNEEAPSQQLRARVLAEVEAAPAQDGTAHAAMAEDGTAHATTAPAQAAGVSTPVPAPTNSTPQAAPARSDNAHSTPGSAGTRRAGTRRTRRRRTVLLAAASVAIGVAATLGVQTVLDSGPADTGSDPAPEFVAAQPSGTPGELGVQEPVSFTEPDLAGGDAESDPEVAVEGALVAHTWGTETVLEITGLPVGSSYSVVLVGEDGEEIESGSFLGSELPVECRMNGAVLREDVDRLEIRAEDGTALTAAELPDVD